jgi:hypothetical protein
MRNRDLLVVAVLSGACIPYPDPICLQFYGLLALLILIPLQLLTPPSECSIPLSLASGCCVLVGATWIEINAARLEDCTPDRFLNHPVPLVASLLIIAICGRR